MFYFKEIADVVSKEDPKLRYKNLVECGKGFVLLFITIFVNYHKQSSNYIMNNQLLAIDVKTILIKN